MGINKSFYVDGKMALNKFKNMKFFRRYKDPQRYDCNDVCVKIRLTNQCNYKCPYCYYRNNKEPNIPWKNLQRIIDFLKILNKDYYYIYIHGGEPTIHPDFIKFNAELNKALQGKDYFIYFDTNFSQDNIQYWYNLLDNVDKSKYKINANLHYGHERPEFYENYRKLYKYGVEMQLNIMVFYSIYYKCLDMFDVLKSEFDNVIPKPVFYLMDEFRYSPLERLFFYEKDPRKFYWIDKNGLENIYSLNEIEFRKLNNFSFLKCDYGKKGIVIDTNGDFYFCTAHHLQRNRIEINSPMNIFNDDLEKYFKIKKPKYCMFHSCSACDLRIKKYGKMKKWT